MTFTKHGRYIPGTPIEDEIPAPKPHCPGLTGCQECIIEAASVLGFNREREIHRDRLLTLFSSRPAVINSTPDFGRGLQTDQEIMVEAMLIVARLAEAGKSSFNLTLEDETQAFLKQVEMIASTIRAGYVENDTDGESNLVQHARTELAHLDNDEDFNEAILSAIRGFTSYGHSGGSAEYAIQLLGDLLQFKNVTPLTDDPDEWMHVGEDELGDLWQSRRRSTAFSRDRGKTYTDLDDRYTEREGNIYHTQPHGMAVPVEKDEAADLSD